MQDYISFAAKNGVTLADLGSCQFCGANTQRGIHECIEVFSLGFQDIDFSSLENHRYRFLIVDAHALQHPEIHGRWSNHFHLSRLHLIFRYKVDWSYGLSPQLSTFLNRNKAKRKDEYLIPPNALDRGNVTSTDVREKSENETACKNLIESWAKAVYDKWQENHPIVDQIAHAFLKRE